MRRPSVALLAVALVLGSAGASTAIEMFTYFGDGSRIGLPSLEVPVEAYPGIPLRSDRIRMRRRALRQGTRGGPAATADTITLREAPLAPRPVPAVPAVPAVPIAPEPE